MSGNPCSGCAVDGDCCHLNEVALTEEDACRLEEGTGVAREGFTSVVDGWLLLGSRMGASGCPFFAAGRCTVHAARPEACRLYPFTAPEGVASDGRLLIARDSVVCPHTGEFTVPFGLERRMRAHLTTLDAERTRRLEAAP